MRFWQARWAALAALCLAAPAQAQSQPNLVFILSDDQGIDAIEGANWPNDLDCRTPNLAGFAAQGRTFAMTRLNSKCSPTRAALLTGRSAIQTGVTDRISPDSGPDAVRLALQGNEHTIAELLQARGYYTILIDKWHLGAYRPLGQAPDQQGFDAYFPYGDYLPLDHPDRVGDEHITRMVNIAVDAVSNRPDPTQPYALFYWSYDPHRRPRDSSGMFWWKVDQSLLPSGINYYDPNHDSNVNRYRAVVEALDTELRRLLFTLGVVTGEGQYDPPSRTVVFYLGDNGTDPEVAPRRRWAKGSVFEGGIRVPMFVFGHNVPRDGRILDDPVDATDFYDTLADIVAAPPESRGTLPRQGMSFADLIGWGEPRPRREFTMSSIMRGGSENWLHVALADRRFKLIARAGYRGFAQFTDDHFFDLAADPDEVVDLIKAGMTAEQRAAYVRMRQEIVNFWPTAVARATPDQADIPLTHLLSTGSDGRIHTDRVPLGHLSPGRPGQIENRLFLRFDIEGINGYLPPGRTFREVERAEILLAFAGDDYENPENGDTGPIQAYPMTIDWFTEQQSWQRLSTRYEPVPLGGVDLPPYVVVEPFGGFMEGIPMPPRTPVSLGQSEDLVRVIRYWRSHPGQNFGVTLIATAQQGVQSDQQLHFLSDAVLRLTLRPR